MLLADVRPRLKRTISIAVGLVILFTAFVLFLIHYVLSSQERLYIDVSRNVVERVQTIKREQLADANLEAAWSNATVEFVVAGEGDWPAAHREHMLETLDIDFSMVLGPQNGIRYHDTAVPEADRAWSALLVEQALGDLLDAARRAHHDDPVSRFGFFMVDGRLAMVAATRIVPDIRIEQLSESYDYDHLLVSGRIVDESYVRLLGVLLDLRRTGLEDCNTLSAAQLPVTDPQGRCLKTITWDIAGSETLYQGLILIVAVYLLLVLGLAFALFRNLYGLTNQFAEHANIDDITGLYNRRYFNTIARDEVARFCRDQAVGSFMLLDIDHFKRLNDRYGHQAGDDALRHIGDTVRNVFRRISDHAFRLGGEEFGIIFVGRDIDEIKSIAERLREAVEALGIENLDNTPYGRLTVSVGVYISKTGNQDCKLETAYRKADQALYAAKNNGRNRVEYVEEA